MPEGLGLGVSQIMGTSRDPGHMQGSQRHSGDRFLKNSVGLIFEAEGTTLNCVVELLAGKPH